MEGVVCREYLMDWMVWKYFVAELGSLEEGLGFGCAVREWLRMLYE